MRRTLAPIGLAALAAMLPATQAPAQESEVTVEQSLVYARRGDTRLAMDAYVPPGGGSRPAVLWIHGGKWSRGDKADPSDIEMSTTIADQGFVVFSVNYRLAIPVIERGSFPQAVADVTAAVEWIRENADDFGVDPGRIAAAGNSAGAHLAAMLATLGEGPLDQGSRISAAVSLSGPMDLEPLLHDENPNLVEAVESFLGCKADDASCADTAREASPVTHVDGSDAPVLLVNADAETIPEEQARTMADALDGAGAPAEVLIPHATQHGLGYWSYEKAYDFEEARLTLPQIFFGFIGEQLGQQVSVEGPPTALPSVAAPSPSPKVASGTGNNEAPPAKVAPEAKGDLGSPEDDSDTGLLIATIVAIVVAAIALATAIGLLRRARTRPPGGGTHPGSKPDREPAGTAR